MSKIESLAIQKAPFQNLSSDEYLTISILLKSTELNLSSEDESVISLENKKIIYAPDSNPAHGRATFKLTSWAKVFLDSNPELKEHICNKVSSKNPINRNQE